MLDLVFCDSRAAVVNCADHSLVKCDKHHPALVIDLCEFQLPVMHYENTIFDFKHCDYVAMSNYLLNVNWDEIFSFNDVNENVEIFYSVVNNVVEYLVPKIVIKNRFKFPIWFDQDLKNNIFKKRDAHLKYKITQDVNDYVEFSQLRSICKTQAQDCYKNYIEDVESKVNSNPRYFWKYIHSKNSDNDIPALMKYNHESSGDGYTVIYLLK